MQPRNDVYNVKQVYYGDTIHQERLNSKPQNE